MMNTTRCLFALGLSVSLAAACGDDDSVSGNGGSGGRAGSGGTGGRAGTGGTGGTGGTTAGTGGTTAGTGGTTAGTGGTGGTGGSSAGTGGTGVIVEPPDGGADAATDAGEVADGGPQPLACPDLDDATADADSSNNAQEVIITRLVFDGADIVVTFRVLADTFNFDNDLLQVCTGSRLNGDCDEGVQLLEGAGVGGNATAFAAGDEVEFTTSFGDVVTAAAGEIALVNGLPAVDTDPIIRAYVNWGDYVSLEATQGPNTGESLEEAAVDEGGGGVWVTGSSVEVNGQTTVYATGDVTDADGFEVCTQAAP
jgi:hypothetical protein